ncbi:putative F-box protein At1g71320 [Papaver somniferum]|uniref:putative F-box protein At1g71320 n=1 Tax=Papaver somniferum TaxID=3469 RepID=UPI000E6F79C2|nr:putative F-box protein At1g71320 [Papaver somniferum]
MENLHSDDILENILLQLPIEPALHAKRVCSTWRVILRCKTDKQGFLFKSCHADCGSRAKGKSNPVRTELFYADVYDQANIKYYYPRNIPTGLVGSCNGLVCSGTIPSLICNPLTGESMVLPINYSEFPRDISNTGRNYSGRLSSGFGYCPSTNEYKVVTIYHNPSAEGHKAHVQGYTVGGEWRYIGFIDRYKRCRFVCFSGIYANGVLYWLYVSDPVLVRLQECEIVAFNLEGETFDYIPLPGLLNYKDFEIPTFICPLKLLGGNNHLYLVHTNCKVSGSTDICVYKKNNISTGGPKLNNQSESSLDWIKELSIQREEKSGIIRLGITTRNDILLWYKRYSPFGYRLCCYDPKTSTLNELWDDDKAYSIDAVPHRHSIASLKDLGETNVTSLKDL